ncbi:hypothetical protein CPB83DRAFT_925054 [Crepidotus variabilis]|uniref:DUF6535 domain-containing protein n=1 Tax=Crepidotus variabilis TaxID=179855 RepID=A0A9P6EIR8_9AGAR|nr:hypothetical protein CPB83DRAFT_925054 [Crepidotus variabilis]
MNKENETPIVGEPQEYREQLPTQDTFKPWTYEDMHDPSYSERANSLNSDFWNIPANYWVAQEKEKCENWKDEVQNLLIFAGLFSAVVTALLVESYQSLQENPSEIFLAQIVTHLAATTANRTTIDNTAAAQVARTFTPSSSSKGINALWFLSLIFSLATALAEAFNRFYVPQIFSALPLLLISGLVLFLVGMIEFLWNLNQQVAIPGIIAISLLLLFLLYTTIWPGLQFLPGRQTRSIKTVPDCPCPYKSPQSWAFLRLIASSKLLIQRTVQSLKTKLGISSDSADQIIAWVVRSTLETRGLNNWISYATMWLNQRDIDSLSQLQPTPHDLIKHHLYGSGNDFPPRYDSVYALCEIKEAYGSIRTNQLEQVYHCFHDVTTFQSGLESVFVDPLTELVHNLILPESLSTSRLTIDFFRQLDPEVPQELIIDYVRLSFMDVRDVEPTPQQLEMCIRFLGWTLDRRYRKRMRYTERVATGTMANLVLQPQFLEER